MSFRVMRFGTPAAAAPGAMAAPPGLAGGDRDAGYPAAESQQAGLDHLMRIARQQAAARPRPAPVDGGDPDGAPGAFQHS